jgi:hypothetical protein
MTTPATYHTFSERFPGLEFEWFAQDAEGNIGIFSTAGFGPVPANVQLYFQDHDRAALSIELTHWGSSDVWKDYAKQGLYVFDWQHWQGPYRKEEAPLGTMNGGFKRQILDIPELPFFDGAFHQIASVAAINAYKER